MLGAFLGFDPLFGYIDAEPSLRRGHHFVVRGDQLIAAAVG